VTGRPVAALHGVSVAYGARVALDDVTLSIRAGERVGLVGPSGAGKSSVLGGLVRPAAGTVELFGRDPGTLRGAGQRRLRARVGTVHQQLHLVGPLKVVHNVNAGRLARWSAGRALWSLVRPQGVDEVRGALARVGLADRISDRTDTLSGGQQQRVALARLMVQAPDLILADEPVSALDPALSAEVLDVLAELAAEPGRALVVSLHDAGWARRSCDRLVGLVAGRVVFDSPVGAVTDDVLRDLYAGALG
jgi:phosphonate transport system ATP-binding protein